VIRVIDNLIVSLRQLRQAIADEDEGTLHALLHNAREDRRIWLQQRQSDNWEPVSKTQLPRAGEVMGRLFGLGKRRSDK
jgi:hypothetical protein